MTTILSKATEIPTGKPPAERPGAPARSASRARKSPWKLATMLATGALALGLGGWAIANWSGSGLAPDAVDQLVVRPRTFTVSLKEKGELKAARSTDVKCEVEGRSTIISLIPEGTAVKKGDLLVELASDEIEDRIRQEELKESNAITEYEAAKTELDIQRDKNTSDVRKAELEIELKHLELEKYQKGDWVQKLKDADIAIEQAQMTLERREQDYTASKELFAKNYTTQTEYEEAEFNFRKAQWDLEKARMAKEVLEQYTHVADLKQRESDLHEATKECERVKKNAEGEEIKKLRTVEGKEKELALIRDQLAKFRTQKEKCKIYAPTQGFVVYYTGGGGRWMMNNDQQIKEGAEVFERQILMQLPDTQVMNAVVRIHEAKTDKLREGQPATVVVEGIPGQVFPGKVSKIAVLADSQSTWLNPDLKEYETAITLDSTEIPLKPGVTAHVEILVDQVVDKLAVPVPAVYAKGGQRYVFRSTGRDAAQPVPIQLGNIGTEWVEVVSGLSNGDSVLLAFTEELKRTIPDKGSDGPAPATAGADQPGGNRRGPGNRRPAAPGAGPQRIGMPAGATPAGNLPADKTQPTQKGAPADKRAGETTRAETLTPDGAREKPAETVAVPAQVPASSSGKTP